MQISFRKVLFASAAAVMLSSPAFAQKIAVVDFGRLVNESPQGKALEAALDSEFNPRKQQLMAQDAALRAKAEKLRKDLATMTEDQRAAAEREMKDGAYELDRKAKMLDDDNRTKRQSEYIKLQKMIASEVNAYAKAQAIDIVLMDGVIYATPTFNITDAMLAALQAKAGKPATTGATSTPKPPAKP